MPSQGFAAVFFPCLLFQAMLFTTMGLSADIWKERKQGTLRRLVSTASRLEALLAGKLLAVALVLVLIGAVGLATGRWLADMPVSNAATAVAWIVFSGVALFVLMLQLQTIASSERAASMLTNLFVMPLMMLGGTFFPFEAMPKQMAAIGQWTPNGWLLIEFKAILAGSMGAGRMAADFGIVAAVAALACVVAARRLRAKFVI